MAKYQNAFFYPHGALFCSILPGNLGFSVYTVGRTRYGGACCRFTFTCIVLSCGRAVLPCDLCVYRFYRGIAVATSVY